MRYVVVLLIHVSFIITLCALPNTMLVYMQEVPGIIKVRRRKCVLPQGGPNPRIMQYIDATSLTRLFKVLDMEIDHALIMALVPLTPWKNGYHLARYKGDAGDSGGWVAYHWEDRPEMERGVPRLVGP